MQVSDDEIRTALVPLPRWMRNALYATGVMNVLAAALFVPGAQALRALAGLPPAEQPVYLATISMFVLLFGLGYLWTALRGWADRLFIAISAVGKLTFVTLIVGFCLAGDLPVQAPLAASGDLAFGVLFLIWLFGPGEAEPAFAARR